MTRKPTVTLLHYASTPSIEEVQAAISAAGHEIVSAAWRDWLAHSGDYPDTLYVFFLQGDQEACTAALDQLNRLDTPVLGLLPAEHPHLAEARRCREFAFWPCSSEELRLRLDRLGACRHKTSPPPLDLTGTAPALAHLNLLGRSPAFLKCVQLLYKLAECEAPVLVEGETGTGKELMARALHYLGPRQGTPFIPVNCGALPDTLFENELFGHERGAFTDAKMNQPGLVAQAEGGTLFLDEVDSLSPKGQVVLLRFLQDRQYRPLGAQRSRQSDVRIIAATNTSLEQRVAEGRFRQDLSYRLDVARLSLPPLRERRQDIPLLAEHFMRQLATRYQRPPKIFHPDTLAWLTQYPWPGNVRELENLVHREFLLADGQVIRIDTGDTDTTTLSGENAGLDWALQGNFTEARNRVLRHFERRYLEQLMTETGGNVTRAAHRAGKERRALGRLLQKHGIDRRNYTPDGHSHKN